MVTTAHPAAPVGQLPGPKAAAVVQRDDQVISPSYTRSYPFVMDHGLGSEVWDVDGRRFIDFTAGVAVLAAGHCHPVVVEAITKQVQRYIHMAGTDFYLPEAVALAETLSRLAPGAEPKQIFFTNSGTESTEAAMKLCHHHTGRPCFISFLGAFHGRTYGSMSLGTSKALHRTHYQPLLAGIYHAPYPNPYRPPFDVPTERLGRACVDYIEHTMLTHLVRPEEVAGIVVETIQGEGGYIIPPPDFYPALRALCTKYNIPLVMDEVQAGMGRTGKMFALQHWEVEPDVIMLAKGIGGGLPLGAIIARKSMMTWPSGAHANTFGGNPVACAAALATIGLLESSLMDNATQVGNAILDRMQAWPDRFPFIGDVRGRGLMIGFDLVEDRALRTPAHDLRDQIVDEAFHQGLLLLGAGTGAIRFCPPLVLTPALADEALTILEGIMARHS
ncbi:MAG: acetyl ornithine aminotransferase family protein [Chloroflexota bacterium]|nr:acetyl ornithine aminotransferase family protein [Chloroflexota bacterium]